jgi:putative membrane protein
MSRPALHALLNATAAVLLVLGWMAIRGKGPFARGGRAERAHKRCMLAALFVSSVFLASYLQYHFTTESVRFWGTGAWRVLYLLVLVPHVVLATLMVPPIVWLLVHALAGRFEQHRRLARWTLPVWLYVSVTGVLVYVMLYRLGPGPG